jgi:hypothetical protein
MENKKLSSDNLKIPESDKGIEKEVEKIKSKIEKSVNTINRYDSDALEKIPYDEFDNEIEITIKTDEKDIESEVGKFASNFLRKHKISLYYYSNLASKDDILIKNMIAVLKSKNEEEILKALNDYSSELKEWVALRVYYYEKI